MSKKWNDIKIYSGEILHLMLEYGNRFIDPSTTTNALKKVSEPIIDRVAVNLKGTMILLDELDVNRHFFFCPIALLQRAIVSDLISFWYYRHLFHSRDEAALKEELFSANRDFLAAYKTMIDEDLAMRNNRRWYDDHFHRLVRMFPAHFSENRSLIGKRACLETQKLQEMNYQDKGVLTMLFKYYAQFQHFSQGMQMLYREKAYVPINQFFSSLVLLLLIDMVIQVITIIDPVESYVNALREVGNRIHATIKTIEFV